MSNQGSIAGDGATSPTPHHHKHKHKDKKKYPDDLLGILTRQDIDDAVAFFAQPDKQVVTREDIRKSLDAYFPHLPSNYRKLLVDPLPKFSTTLNRSMKKEHLYHLFGMDDDSHFDDEDEDEEDRERRNRSVLDSPRELEAYALFVPNKKGLIADRMMKSIMIQGYNKLHGNDHTPGAVTYLSYDKDALLKAFDFDKDGHISVDDLKSVRVTHEERLADEARRQELANRAVMENALKRRLSVSPAKFAAQMAAGVSPTSSMSPTSNSPGSNGQGGGQSVSTSGENLKR